MLAFGCGSYSMVCSLQARLTATGIDPAVRDCAMSGIITLPSEVLRRQIHGYVVRSSYPF